jgi:hypothetical protein
MMAHDISAIALAVSLTAVVVVMFSCWGGR